MGVRRPGVCGCSSPGRAGKISQPAGLRSPRAPRGAAPPGATVAGDSKQKKHPQSYILTPGCANRRATGPYVTPPLPWAMAWPPRPPPARALPERRARERGAHATDPRDGRRGTPTRNGLTLSVSYTPTHAFIIPDTHFRPSRRWHTTHPSINIPMCKIRPKSPAATTDDPHESRLPHGSGAPCLMSSWSRGSLLSGSLQPASSRPPHAFASSRQHRPCQPARPAPEHRQHKTGRGAAGGARHHHSPSAAASAAAARRPRSSSS